MGKSFSGKNKKSLKKGLVSLIAAMDRFICCFGGGSSSKVVQDPSELPQPPEPSDSSDSPGHTDSSESIEEEGEFENIYRTP